MFVDLKKAYYSVPKGALWTVLKKCGVPPKILGVIRFFTREEFGQVLMFLVHCMLHPYPPLNLLEGALL